MSALEDTRKLLQDIVTPDLKALSVRVDALDSRVDSLERTMKDGFAQAERTAIERQQQFEKLDAVRSDLIAQRIESLANALQFDRRLERLEREKAAGSATGPGTELARSA